MIYPSRFTSRMAWGITLVTSLVMVAMVGCAPPDWKVGEGQEVAVSSSPAPTSVAQVEVSPTFTPHPLPTGTLGSTPAPTATSTPEPRLAFSVTPTPVGQASPTPCVLASVVAPTLPAEIPGYAQLDGSTGLHVTGTYQQIDPVTYRLTVTGKVKNPLSLSYDDLRCMPKAEVHCKLVCPETFVDEATWAGVPLDYVLDLAGMQSGAEGIKLTSADGFSVSISMLELDSKGNLLAYEWEGEPLPILHGFPVRAVFPELVGGRWVKWLIEIEVY